MTEKRWDGKEYGDPTYMDEFINDHPKTSVILFFVIILSILLFAKYCLAGVSL